MAPQGHLHDTDYRDLLPLFRQLVEPSMSATERDGLRERLVSGHLPLAEHIAMKYRHRGQSVDDLRQVARMGLVAAVNRFDPERGSDFVAFAVPTIMGEVRRYFRDSTWSVSVPRGLKELNRTISTAVTELTAELGRAPRPQQLSARLGISLEAVYDGLQAGMAYRAESLDLPATPQSESRVLDQFGIEDAGLERVENRDTLRRALADLPERETEIVRLRFFDELTQRQIADRIGVSQVHVSRLIASSIARLRRSFLPASA